MKEGGLCPLFFSFKRIPERILYFVSSGNTICCDLYQFGRGDRRMNQDTQEVQTQTWEESHPWLSQLTDKDDDDTLGEVIRYTLDELRLA